MNVHGWRCWRCRLYGGRGGSRTRAAVGGLQWSRPWPLRAVWLVLEGGVVVLEGNKASGVALG